MMDEDEEENEEFFIHLPSNACPSIYPLNTASDYSIQLNDPIQLDRKGGGGGGQWCVALSDISYTTVLQTIEHETIRSAIPQVKNKFVDRIEIDDDGNYYWKWSFHNINDLLSLYPKINESNRGELMYKICVELMKICSPKYVIFGFYRRRRENSYWEDVPPNDFKLHFDLYDYKVQIDIRKANFFLQLSDQLLQILGFCQRKTFFNSQVFTAHMDATESIGETELSSTNNELIMDKLYSFLQQPNQQFIIKSIGVSITIQQIIDYWERKQLSSLTGCQLQIDEETYRLSIIKSSPPTKIVFLSKGLSSFLHLYDQILCFPVTYSNPAAESVNLEEQCNTSTTTVLDEEWLIKVYDTKLYMDNVKEHYKWLEFNKIIIDLPSRSYSTPTELIDDLNRKLQVYKIKFELVKTNKVKIEVAAHHFMLIEARLQEILGFNTLSTFTSGLYISDSRINLQTHVRTLSVYTNIIDYVHVGSRMEQLLRTFLHDSNIHNDDRIVMKEFVHNIYIPVRENCISCIKILICDENSKPIPFHHGKTMVTLHFKKCG